MDPSRSRDCDNRVVRVAATAGAFQKLGLEVFGLPRAEFIPGAHDVGAMGVDCWVERGLLQHVEHLRCMAATAENDEQVNRLALAANFGDRRILRYCERDEDGLEVKNQSVQGYC